MMLGWNSRKKALLKEYEMLRQLMEKHDTQISQLRAILVSFLGIYFGWIFKDLECINELKNLHWILFLVPLLITVFFSINEGFIQYWKHKAVCRFKYLECMLEKFFECKVDIEDIRGPHMRLVEKPKEESEPSEEDECREESEPSEEDECREEDGCSYYDEGIPKGIREVVGRSYFNCFYLPIVAILLGAIAFVHSGKFANGIAVLIVVELCHLVLSYLTKKDCNTP
jgi:hypothetical protein